MIEKNKIVILQHLHFDLCFGRKGDVGPVTCTCASSVQEVVVWTAFIPACHGPEKVKKN